MFKIEFTFMQVGFNVNSTFPVLRAPPFFGWKKAKLKKFHIQFQMYIFF